MNWYKENYYKVVDAYVEFLLKRGIEEEKVKARTLKRNVDRLRELDKEREGED